MDLFDLARILVVRYLLRFARKLLERYLNKHRRHWAHATVTALDTALGQLELEVHERVVRWRHPLTRWVREKRRVVMMAMNRDPGELGSDAQMSDEQRAALEHRADLDQARTLEEERKTAAQRSDGDEG
jgi:hypothetical protein